MTLVQSGYSRLPQARMGRNARQLELQTVACSNLSALRATLGELAKTASPADRPGVE